MMGLRLVEMMHRGGLMGWGGNLVDSACVWKFSVEFA